MKLIALGDNVIDYYHNTQECFPRNELSRTF